jgi:hypothetical protein
VSVRISTCNPTVWAALIYRTKHGTWKTSAELFQFDLTTLRLQRKVLLNDLSSRCSNYRLGTSHLNNVAVLHAITASQAQYTLDVCLVNLRTGTQQRVSSTHPIPDSHLSNMAAKRSGHSDGDVILHPGGDVCCVLFLNDDHVLRDFQTMRM